MKKNIKFFILVASLIVAQQSLIGGALNNEKLASWRNSLATRDASGTIIANTLSTVGAYVSAGMDAADANFIKDFVTRGASNLDSTIMQVASLSRNDARALTTTVNNFFASVQTNLGLKNTLGSYKKRWLNKINSITSRS